MILGFVGTGAITEAIVSGIIRANYPVTTILISTRNAQTASRLASLSPKARIVEDNQQIVDSAQLVFLAVRPQDARAVVTALAFPPGCQVVSLIATTRSETLKEWIGQEVSITRATPVPSVAQLSGVTAIYPHSKIVADLFGKLGTVVTATSLQEYDGYAAASSLMGTYFGLLEVTAKWMVDQGAEYDRARTYLGALFSGLTQTMVTDSRSFSDLIGTVTTAKGLNEQVWRQFNTDGGTGALRAALTAVAKTIETSSLHSD